MSLCKTDNVRDIIPKVFLMLILVILLSLLFGLKSLVVVPLSFLFAFPIYLFLFALLQCTPLRVGDLPSGLHVDADWPIHLAYVCFFLALACIYFLFGIQPTIGGGLISISLFLLSTI